MDNRIIPGLDIVKFFLSILIVDIHVQGYLALPLPIQQYVVHPLEGLAVPTFFVISSFLFFRKVRDSEHSSWDKVIHFLKRICILYIFWCIVWSPIIYIQKEYLHPVDAMTPLNILRDFFFGYMFDASWFLGALIVGVPIIYMLSKIFRNDLLVMILPVLIYLYLRFHESLPSELQSLYEWYNSFKNPNLSFPGSLMWIGLGFVLANKKVLVYLDGTKNKVAWSCLMFFLVLNMITVVPVVFFILSVISLFVAAYTLKLPEHPDLYRRLRIYSILFYVIHDCFKKIPKQLFGMENGVGLFIITLAFCFIISEFIIRMKNVKGWGWLKYAY